MNKRLSINIEKKLNRFNLNINIKSSAKYIGILGESGAGKSMTLKCIAGIENPDQGEITYGSDIFFDSGKKVNVIPQDRHVGYMFQDYALFPTMTVYENVCAGIRDCKDRNTDKIVREYLDRFHISEIAGEYPSKISGGQKQRVALARILIGKPDMILLDEPFSALDNVLKEEMQREFMTYLSDYEGTVIMVSHNSDEIDRFSEEIFEISEGVCNQNVKTIDFSKKISMKLIKTEDAVGQILCHDITQIIKGVKKDAVFRKGHVICEEDIPVLLSVGKENIYIWENDESILHENDAAEILCKICMGDNLERGEVKEGKIELRATCDGLLKIDRNKLLKINSAGEMMIASRHGDFAVSKGDKVAGTRIIPLVISKEKMQNIYDQTGPAIFNVIPFTHKKVGIVTTGSEVLKGRIEDTFTPVIKEKLSEYDVEIIGQIYPGDDHEAITEAIVNLISMGADMIITTGGMSVDPDDRTPLAIKNTGAKIISYGAPVLPGAMFMLAYYGDTKIPIVGLPGCVMYARRTIFDLVLPRILADDSITASELNSLGEGGLCLNCEVCTFPNCGFGK